MIIPFYFVVLCKVALLDDDSKGKRVQDIGYHIGAGSSTTLAISRTNVRFAGCLDGGL